MGKLDGKVALITGAARGQGRSHAETFAREGADIAALDICRSLPYPRYPLATRKDLDETLRLVEAEGRRALGLVADVRSASEVERAVGQTIETFGHIDILFCNAGVCDMANTWDFTEEMWDTMIDVNLKGTWLMIKHVVPHMLERNAGGRILITTSTAGHRGLKGLGHYCAAKWGIVGLAKTLAMEIAPHRITVNLIVPMGCNTPMMDGLIQIVGSREKMLQQQTMSTPLPVSLIEPIDVSRAALWLASEEARYVTGAEFRVDGGQSLI